jgi:hypothetical protein
MASPPRTADGWRSATPAEAEACRAAAAPVTLETVSRPADAKDPHTGDDFIRGTSSAHSPLDFPVALVGAHRDVTRRWKPITHRAVKCGDWDAAIRNLEMRPIHDLSGSFITSGPIPFLPEDCILLYPVLDLLMPACESHDRSVWYATQRNLFLKGFDHFWFCLASLAPAEYLIFTENSDADAPNVAKIALPKLLRWWDVFCDLADRFYTPFGTPLKWTSWGGRALAFSGILGMPEQHIKSLYRSDPRTAGKQMTDWFNGLDHQDTSAT